MLNKIIGRSNNDGLFKLNIPRFFSVLWTLLILFRIPRVLGMGIIYSTSYVTRTIGDFGVTFVFTVFDLVTVIIGVLLMLKKRNRVFLLLFALILSHNVLRLLLERSNMFELESYEVFLSLLVSISCCLILFEHFNSVKDIDILFKTIILICFTTQLYYAATGRGTEEIVLGYGYGYGALGIGSGALGVMYSSFILMFLIKKDNKKKNDWFMLVLTIIGIILTGSRTNILLLFVFLVVYTLFYQSSRKLTKWLLIFGFLATYIVIYLSQTIVIIENEKIRSLFSILRGDVFANILDNVSVVERLESFGFAFQILLNNPLGIACSAKDLVQQMIDLGGVTFPHSYLLCSYLMYGLSGLAIYLSYIKLFFESKKGKSNCTLILGYLIVLFTIYGGISTDYLSFFWFCLIYKFSKLYLSEKGWVRIKSNNLHRVTRADTNPVM